SPMVAAAVLIERLLDLALQRTLPGFQHSLKHTLAYFELTAWAVVFPPSLEIGGRPVFIAHGIKSGNSALLTAAAKQGLDALFPREGPSERMLSTLAREMNPEPNSRCHIVRSKQERGGELFLFSYRSASTPALSPADLDVLSQVGQILDRCFLAL